MAVQRVVNRFQLTPGIAIGRHSERKLIFL